MRRLAAVAFVLLVAAAGVAPAGASHRTGDGDPHNCLGEFHSSAARNPALHPLGQVVSGVLVPSAHPFGREFVKDRATECEGLE